MRKCVFTTGTKLCTKVSDYLKIQNGKHAADLSLKIVVKFAKCFTFRWWIIITKIYIICDTWSHIWTTLYLKFSFGLNYCFHYGVMIGSDAFSKNSTLVVYLFWFSLFWLNKPTNMCKLNNLVHLKYKMAKYITNKVSLAGTALMLDHWKKKIDKLNIVWRWLGLMANECIAL